MRSNLFARLELDCDFVLASTGCLDVEGTMFRGLAYETARDCGYDHDAALVVVGLFVRWRKAKPLRPIPMVRGVVLPTTGWS